MSLNPVMTPPSESLLDSLSQSLRPNDHERPLLPQVRALYAHLSERLIQAGHERGEAIDATAWLAGVQPQTVERWREALDLDPGRPWTPPSWPEDLDR